MHSEALVLPNTEVLAPTSGHEIGPERGVILSLKSPVIETVTDADGASHDVIAKLHLPQYAYEGDGGPRTTILVSRTTQPGHKRKDPPTVGLAYHRQLPDGSLQNTSLLDLNVSAQSYSSKPKVPASEMPGFSIDATVLPPRNHKTSSTEAVLNFEVQRFSAPGDFSMRELDKTKANLPVIETAAEVEPTILPKDKLSDYRSNSWGQAETSRGRRLKTTIVKAVAAVAMTVGLAKGLVDTGGLYDKAVDLRHNASDFVHDKFQGKDFAEQTAIDQVARTMQDLDTGNVDAIKERAAQFDRKFSGELMSKDQLAKLQERIVQAKSHKEVAQVTDEFMKFYGKGAEILNTSDPNLIRSIRSLAEKDTPLENLKASALGTISALSIFPKNVFANTFDFRRIEFGTASRTIDQHGTVTVTGAAGELVSPSYNSWRYIRIAVPTEPVDKEILHDAAASIVLHELNHSRKDHKHDPFASTGYKGTPEQHDEFGDKEFWDKPEYASTYAMANLGEEQDSETFAHTFTPGGQNRFASPDAVRRFESKLGVDMLRELIEWEQRAPGIVDRLMSTNGPGFNAPWYTSWLNPR